MVKHIAHTSLYDWIFKSHNYAKYECNMMFIEHLCNLEKINPLFDFVNVDGEGVFAFVFSLGVGGKWL